MPSRLRTQPYWDSSERNKPTQRHLFSLLRVALLPLPPSAQAQRAVGSADVLHQRRVQYL